MHNAPTRQIHQTHQTPPKIGQIAKAVSGKALEEALESAFAPGPRPLTQFELERIDEVISDLKMDREVAKAVFAEVRGAGGARGCDSPVACGWRPGGGGDVFGIGAAAAASKKRLAGPIAPRRAAAPRPCLRSLARELAS